MSKTAHTPGPWKAEPSGGKGSWVKGSNEEWAALACGDTHEAAEANARLIAASPDLLASAIHTMNALAEEYRITEKHSDEWIYDELGSVLSEAYFAARAAIAKATGAA